MKRGAVHQMVGGLRPRRSAHDLSHEVKLSCNYGQLIPIMCDEMVPGDHFRVGAQAVVRMHPMISPIMHEVSVVAHYFFVPYRILWSKWEQFITGGSRGDDASVLPRWSPDANDLKLGSLWDYLGFPLRHYLTVQPPAVDHGITPMAFPRRAYNAIYNEYYRDENLQPRIGETDIYVNEEYDVENLDGNSQVLYRNWTKDYFTSALPMQQRGIAPAIPLQGDLSVYMYPDRNGSPVENQVYAQSDGNSSSLFSNAPAVGGRVVLTGAQTSGLHSGVYPLFADLSQGVSANISDLRLAVQIQKWMERNMRAGVRYTEFLRAHFGVSPRDERLQRPEYIGGTKMHLSVSEVLQTSATVGSGPSGTDTPQGTMAGHGLSAGGGRVGNYFATEFGLIMGIMSIVPTPSYEDGIDRQWLRRTRYDFYFPEFAHLSEQGIYNAEIYAQNKTDDLSVWGYQPQYDEMRIKRNRVCGQMRVNTPSAAESLAYWHLGRAFDSLPNLNGDFVSYESYNIDRAFAVTDFPHAVVSWGNVVKGVRPIPTLGEPGMLDHF